MPDGASHFIPPGQEPCASCGKAIDPKQALYSNQGYLVCDACFSAAKVDTGLHRTARGLAFGALGAAAMSWIVNPVFIATVIALGNGTAALRLMLRADVKTALGPRFGTIQALAMAALAMASARVLYDLVLFGFTFLAR